MKKYINNILCAFVFLMAIISLDLTPKAFEFLNTYDGKTGEFKITDFYVSDTIFSNSTGDYLLVKPGLPQAMTGYAEAEYEGLKIYVPDWFTNWDVVPIIDIPQTQGTFEVGVFIPGAD